MTLFSTPLSKIFLSKKTLFFFTILFFAAIFTATSQTSVLGSDVFTNVNSTLLGNHTSSSGHAWVRHPSSAGNAIISGNTVRDQNGNEPLYYLNMVPPTSEYEVQIDVSGPSYAMGPAARIDTAVNNAYLVYWSSGWRLVRNSNGIGTVLGSYVGDSPATAVQTVKLQVTNASKKVFINGIERISSSDNIITGTGMAGIGFSGVTSDFGDNFTVSSIGTPTSDTTPPSVPTSLSATAVSSSQINLAWTASTDNVGVTGYRIYRGGTQIATSATNSYSNTGLTASTAYSYTVSSYDAAGNNSAQTASFSATTPTPDTIPPSVPTSLSATAISSSQINLAWTASTDNV